MKYILSAAVIFAAAVLLINPAATAEYVGAAVHSCLEIIIPSLFSMTVLSVYLQSSGLYRTALKPLTFPLSKLLKLPEELCAVIVLGNIGGYPVGARLLTSLVSEGRISAKSAERLLCCCYGSGPSFVICIAGVGIFGSAALGGIIFLACFLSSIITAMIVCRGRNINLSDASHSLDLSAGCFISSVAAAAKVMFTVCAMIIGFSAAAAVLDISGISGFIESFFSIVISGGNAEPLFSALLEISRIKELSPKGGYVIPLCGALLSFGGVCVIMQIKALTGGLIPMGRFLVSRVYSSVIAAAISCVGFILPQSVVETIANSTAKTKEFSVNAGMSVSVIIMCGILLVSLHKENKPQLP